MRERVSEAETKLDEAKAEMIRMSESIAEVRKKRAKSNTRNSRNGPSIMPVE